MSQQDNRIPILIAGDAAVPTGFCRVIESIFKPLQDRYEIYHLGTNYHGDPHPYDWKVFPAGLGGGIWGTHRMRHLVDRIKPEFIFIVNDLWILVDYMKELDGIADRPPVIMYCPVDAGPLETEPFESLQRVERFVTYTQFGKGEVDAATSMLRQEKPDFQFPEVDVVPHGVDCDVFFPLVDNTPSEASRLAAREALFQHEPELHNAFIVLNANRNQPRKRIDITMRGFALFAEGKPDNVKLYLHMGVEDQGWHIQRLAKRLGIENRLVLSTLETVLPNFSTKHLNHVFNACDIGINTSFGEGWGLVSFEHAATGAAQIVPRHGACAELWNDGGVFMEPTINLITEKIMTEGWLVTPEAVATAIEKLYSDRDYRVEMSLRAYKAATAEEYQWSEISRRWDVMFQDVLAETQQETQAGQII